MASRSRCWPQILASRVRLKRFLPSPKNGGAQSRWTSRVTSPAVVSNLTVNAEGRLCVQICRIDESGDICADRITEPRKSMGIGANNITGSDSTWNSSCATFRTNVAGGLHHAYRLMMEPLTERLLFCRLQDNSGWRDN